MDSLSNPPTPLPSEAVAIEGALTLDYSDRVDAAVGLHVLTHGSYTHIITVLCSTCAHATVCEQAEHTVHTTLSPRTLPVSKHDTPVCAQFIRAATPHATQRAPCTTPYSPELPTCASSRGVASIPLCSRLAEAMPRALRLGEGRKRNTFGFGALSSRR